MPERELGSSWKCKAIITLDIRIMCIPIVRMYRYVVCQYAKIMLNSHLIMMKWTIVSGLAYYYITLNFLRPSSRAFSREVHTIRGFQIASNTAKYREFNSRWEHIYFSSKFRGFFSEILTRVFDNSRLLFNGCKTVKSNEDKLLWTFISFLFFWAENGCHWVDDVQNIMASLGYVF